MQNNHRHIPLAFFHLLALAITGCAAEPAEPAAVQETPEALVAAGAGGVGPGFLFGGAAGTVASQRQDLIDADVPAALAARSTFDGSNGNVDSANNIQDIADRVACDARSAITANIALHAPGQGDAKSFKEWGSDQRWIDGLDALAHALKGIKQADGVTPQPIYLRYAKEFNQGAPTCVSWLHEAALFHDRSCADELFWQWRQVRQALAAAPNVKLVWCPTGQLVPTRATSNPAAAVADELWPGSALVDVIGPDAYNGKRPENADPAGAFSDFVALADAAHKPFLISETGIVKGFAKGAPFVDDNWYADLFQYLTDVESGRAAPHGHSVDVIGVAGFWRSTDFGDSTLRPGEGHQLAAPNGFLRAQPQRPQACVGN